MSDAQSIGTPSNRTHSPLARRERLASPPPPPVLGKRRTRKSPYAYPEILLHTSICSGSPKPEDDSVQGETEKEEEEGMGDGKYVDSSPPRRTARVSRSSSQAVGASSKPAKRAKISSFHDDGTLLFPSWAEAAYTGISLNGTKCPLCPTTKFKRVAKKCAIPDVQLNMHRHVTDQHRLPLCGQHRKGETESEPDKMLILVFLLLPGVKLHIKDQGPDTPLREQIKELEKAYGQWRPANRNFKGFDKFDYYDDRWNLLTGAIELRVAITNSHKCICSDKEYSRRDGVLRHIRRARGGMHAVSSGH